MGLEKAENTLNDRLAPTTVLIVEDSKLTRAHLRKTLQLAGPGVQLVGEAENGLEALESVATLLPQVVLMDIGMPILDGITATQRIMAAYPETHIVMLTSHEADEDILEAFQSGAISYCLKDIEPEQLLMVIEMTAQGQSWIEPRVARTVLGALRRADPQKTTLSPESSTLMPLTEREADVLRLLAEGLSNQEIVSQLAISLNTVKTHLKNIFIKLDVPDRTAAAIKARRDRIV